MLREYQSEIEKLKQMIEKGGFEGGEVVPSEVQIKSVCLFPVRYFYFTFTTLLNKSNQFVSKCIPI